jgi:membrane protease YdiL (CAAX protease family)
MRQRLLAAGAMNPLVTFFVFAYLFAWVVMIPMVLLRLPPQLMIVATCGPSFAALLTNRLVAGRYKFWLRTDWLRSIFSAALGVLLVMLSYVILPAVWAASPDKLNWGSFATLSVFNYSTLLGGPLGEEPGWRGYALPRLEGRFGALLGTLLLGFLWSAWHLPLFLRPGWEGQRFWVYTITVVGLTIMMSYCVNLARFSLITAIATHAAFNTIPKWLNGLVGNADLSLPVSPDLLIALPGLVVAVLLVFATRGKLAYSPKGR